MIRSLQWLLVAVTSMGLCWQKPESANSDQVQFQIVTDKSVYRPHSTMTIKFLISNTGRDPVYIHSSVVECESIYGQFELQILDRYGRDLRKWKCSSEDVYPGMQTIDPVAELQNHWIRLGSHNIFGWQKKIVVPTIEGVYRLKADLIPSRNFGARQKEILQQKGMRILNSRHEAQIVSITVK